MPQWSINKYYRNIDWIDVTINTIVTCWFSEVDPAFKCYGLMIDCVFVFHGQVPIQVNKYLAYSDGMRVIESGRLSMQTPASDGLLFTEMDR